MLTTLTESTSMTDTVKCLICEKQYKSLITHLRAHKISTKDYTEKYGGPLIADSVRKKLAPSAEVKRRISEAATKSNKRRWAEDREASISQLNAARDKRDMKKMSIASSERITEQWKDPEFRERVISAVSGSNKKRWTEDREKEIEHSIAGGKSHSFEHLDAMRKAQWNPDHPAYETSMKNLHKLQQSDYRKERLSERGKELWAARHYKDRDSYKGHRYQGHWFRSSWELTFAQWLDRYELKWSYESKMFNLLIEGDRVNYLPDFYVEQWSCYIEVKADWAWDSNARQCRDKLEAVAALDINIETVRDKDIAMMRTELESEITSKNNLRVST